MRILSVVGARPNFMKLAPVHRALRGADGFEHVIVHTGQHYDRGMSDTFFDDLEIPEPTHNLGVGSGSHAQQTASVMRAFEPICIDERPDIVLVYGDVNSTVAAALVTAKLGRKVGHVEAGLRSFDWTMPEEINRVVTDRLADLLFTPSSDGDENLRAEGIDADRIHCVGNVMIDTLVHALPKARAAGMAERLGLSTRAYAVVTLHRPSNVDRPEVLAGLMRALAEVSQSIPIVFPVHPRTRERIAALGQAEPRDSGLHLMDPIGYLDMLSVVSEARLVITDSGGLQEETTYLGVPCLTVRDNTERPITITQGTNRLVDVQPQAIVAAARASLNGHDRVASDIPLWDGRAAERIVEVLGRL